MNKRVFVLFTLCLAVLCAALFVSMIVKVSADNKVLPTTTPLPSAIQPSSTFTPTVTSTVTPQPTFTSTPSKTPTQTRTPTPQPTVYVFTNTVEDVYAVAEMLGLPVIEGSHCVDPVFKLKTGKCFQDIGEHPKGEKLEGPYFIGLFHELGSGPAFVTLRFFVIKWPEPDYMPSHITLGVSADHASLFENKWTRSKGSNWVYPAYLWRISKTEFDEFSSKGFEFKVTDWYEIFGP